MISSFSVAKLVDHQQHKHQHKQPLGLQSSK